MNSDDALRIAQAVASKRALLFSYHADVRGEERWATHEDIYCAVLSADVAVQSPDGPNRWVLVGGCDEDGCGLRVVVAIGDEDVVTVTVVTVWS